MIKNYKFYWFFFSFFLPVLFAAAQTSQLSLEECYRLAKRNYPASKKLDLINKSSRFSLANASKLYLPQLNINGQATHQSQTVSFPEALTSAPGINLPDISKQQYKIQADINQTIYDGGSISNQRASIKANEEIQQQSIELELYTLNERVNQLFFSILLIDDQYKQNEIRKTDLQSSADKIAASLKNGTAFRSNLDQIKAELIGADMTTIEINANREAYLQMLGLLIGKSLNNETKLITPQAVTMQTRINRPELKLYDLQKKAYEVDEKKLNADYLPKLSAFFQSAYGRPTLNFISNNAGTWYITGLKLSWNLASLYTVKNAKKIIDINRQTVETDRETFLLNTNISLVQQNGELKKYNELIEADKKAIALRESVKEAAKAQLDNGVITVDDYISQLNAENLARLSLTLHQIQLLQSQYQIKQTSGN